MNPDGVKSAIDEASIAPLRTLPGMDLALASIAARLARHARPLLLANQALLLSVTSNTLDDHAPLWTCLWDARCTLILRRPMRGTGAVPQQRAALETAANMLLTNLIGRWPANAIPPAVGIVTDGGGVAFSPDYPSPLSPNWLALHQAGLCPTTTLLPFSPNGAWSQLIAPNVAPYIH